MHRPTRTSGLAAFARLSPALVMVGWLTLALPAAAQQAAGRNSDTGMRYLTWPGKVERSAVTPTPVPGRAAREDRADAPGPIMTFPDAPVRPTTRYSARTSPGPTPAGAWIAPRAAPTLYAPPADRDARSYAAPAYASPPHATGPYPAPTYAPALALLPEPPRDYARSAPIEAAPAPRPEVSAPRYEPSRVIERPKDRPTAADRGRAMPEPMPEPPTVAPAPVAVADPAFDPMAPRRDAPIFRLLGPDRAPAPVLAPDVSEAPATEPPATPRVQPAPAAEAAPVPAAVSTADPSADRTPRYYSVHRANGQRPDRTPLPDPVYLDSAPVDLAQPPATPTVLRNPDGSVRAIVPNEDPTLP